MALPPAFHELAAEVSNRGRWGDEDRRGTLNLIDQAAVLRGVAAVRTGRTFSLAIPFDEDGAGAHELLVVTGRTFGSSEPVYVLARDPADGF
ncbi:MAG: cyclase family protein, partial [Actinomycetota bacterium]